MTSEDVTRRLFLKGGGAFAGSTLLRAGAPALIALAESACSARDSGSGFEHLSAFEAREIEAMAARIIPTTDTPGAREAGVIHFFDQAVDSILRDEARQIRDGLDDFLSGVTEPFSSLSEAEQDRYLEAQQGTEYFHRIRDMTVKGFFGMSHYGGNRNEAGWKLVGMDGPPHAWQPPFGHYDTEYMRRDQDGD